MVLVHIKQGEAKPEFVFETSVARNVGELCGELVAVHNRAAVVAHFGTLIDKLVAQPQPEGVPAHVAEMLTRVAAEARALVAPAQAERRIAVSVAQLDEAIATARDALATAFAPQPPPEALLAVLADVASAPGALSEADTRCWWAGKELDPAKTLGDYVGRNEKTKVVVRLSRTGLPPTTSATGAPTARSAAESAQALAEWRRRRDEQERMAAAADDGDTFDTPAWADPQGLKKAMSGVTDITWHF